ncbi:MAG TPA: hypothetical protein VF791_14445 [Pyrinomonadaceae bacterium]
MLTKTFVCGLLFCDAICQLTLFEFPQVQVAHYLTTWRRPHIGVSQDVVYVAALLDEIHRTPPNDFRSHLRKSGKAQGNINTNLAHQIIENFLRKFGAPYISPRERATAYLARECGRPFKAQGVSPYHYPHLCKLNKCGS